MGFCMSLKNAVLSSPRRQARKGPQRKPTTSHWLRRLAVSDLAGGLNQWISRLLKSLFVACALLSPVAFAQDVENQSAAAEFGTTNSEMLAAIAQARASLDTFLALVSYPEPETSGFKMKILVRDGKDLETFWVRPFWILDDGFEGAIANTPDVVRNVSLGETVTFSRDVVVDWGYVRNGRQVGSFTVCVLFKYMRPADVEYFRRYNGFDC